MDRLAIVILIIVAAIIGAGAHAQFGSPYEEAPHPDNITPTPTDTESPYDKAPHPTITPEPTDTPIQTPTPTPIQRTCEMYGEATLHKDPYGDTWNVVDVFCNYENGTLVHKVCLNSPTENGVTTEKCIEEEVNYAPHSVDLD